MTAREFIEWQEYYKLEPWGDDWLQTSIIAWSNLQPWTKKKLRADRFVPRLTQARKDPKALEALFNQFEKRHNKSAGG